MPEVDVIVISSLSKFRKALSEKIADGWELVGAVQTLSVNEGWFVATLKRDTGGPSPTPTLPLEQQ